MLLITNCLTVKIKTGYKFLFEILFCYPQCWLSSSKCFFLFTWINFFCWSLVLLLIVLPFSQMWYSFKKDHLLYVWRFHKYFLSESFMSVSFVCNLLTGLLKENIFEEMTNRNMKRKCWCLFFTSFTWALLVFFFILDWLLWIFVIHLHTLIRNLTMFHHLKSTCWSITLWVFEKECPHWHSKALATT